MRSHMSSGPVWPRTIQEWLFIHPVEHVLSSSLSTMVCVGNKWGITSSWSLLEKRVTKCLSDARQRTSQDSHSHTSCFQDADPMSPCIPFTHAVASMKGLALIEAWAPGHAHSVTELGLAQEPLCPWHRGQTGLEPGFLSPLCWQSDHIFGWKWRRRWF